jgi:hypothetical protein
MDLNAKDEIADAAECTPFQGIVAERFGVLPNFFRSGASATGLIEQLWSFALAAYLDNPLPSRFKERLFVFLSQFCPIRYCIVRHVGFLIGLGRPAGDAVALPHTIEQVMLLLQRPRPSVARFEQAIARLSSRVTAPEMPEPETEFEKDMFDALTLLFLSPLSGLRARQAICVAVGESNFEFLIAFLAFIRMAHYWTETHPEIEIEADMRAVMANNEILAQLLLNARGPGA